MTKVAMFHPYVNQMAIQNVINVLESRWIGQDAKVDEFERRMSDLDYRWPIMVNSGTSALHLALILAGVQPGDEVITTALTCTATQHPIYHCGATPVFADIQYETGNIDPLDIKKRITSKTAAIMPVHWGGLPCDMDEINDIAEVNDLPVVQDAAHALGSTYKGQNLSWLSDFACYSFQAIKMITTGDGGMLCVPSAKTRERAKALRWFAIDREDREPTPDGYWKHDVIELGYKYQPNDVMAAIGLGNLQDYHALLEHRQQVATMYIEGLTGIPGLGYFDEPNDRQSAYWLFSVHVERREDFWRAMNSRGVQTSIVHRRNDIFTVFGGQRDDLPNLDKFDKTYISIPIHNMLTQEDVEYVINSIRAGW